MRLERRVERLEALHEPKAGNTILMSQRPGPSKDDTMRAAGVDPSTITAMLPVTRGEGPADPAVDHDSAQAAL